MWGGWVFAWPVYTHITYITVNAGSRCSEQYGDSFVKAWAVEATV